MYKRQQWYLNYLNRHKALDWLTTERNSRIAPQEISGFFPDASTVTTDFATELSQLSRNKDIRMMTIFVDNEYDKWHPENFTYNRMVQELELSGVTVSFATKGKVDLSESSAEARATILPILLKHDFKHYDATAYENEILPLLSVTFNDGRTRTYFGTQLITSLSEHWGSGDIYSSFNFHAISYNDMSISDILAGVAQHSDSIMFDTRIKENCSYSTFFNVLKSDKTDDWKTIKSNLYGKSVNIEYSDRYLFSPLGIMLLSNFVKQIKEDYGLSIQTLRINVTRVNDGGDMSSSSTKIGESFRNNDKRNEFLTSALYELVGVSPEVSDSGYIQHERCLTIKTEDGELCIRPDAGISNGWKPFGSENAEATDCVFAYDWSLDMDLYNQKKNYSGILYTVSYKRC